VPLLVAVLGALVALLGAVLGYMLRVREWQREKRFAAYSEFIASFFELNRRAVVLFGATDRESRHQAYRDFVPSWERWGVSMGQVDLLGADQTRAAAADCNVLVSAKVWPRADAIVFDGAEVPEDEARELQWEGLIRHQAFLRAATRELGARPFVPRRTRALVDSKRHATSDS
jgi:hypothetical protein